MREKIDGEGGEQRSDGKDCRKNGVWRSVVCFRRRQSVRKGNGRVDEDLPAG